MNQPQSEKLESADPRILFAAERTLLAWVRTGLALMGFGFVVARFGLFLRELAAARGNAVPTSRGESQVGSPFFAILPLSIIVRLK